MAYITNKPYLLADDHILGQLIDSAVPGKKRFQRASDGKVFYVIPDTGYADWNTPDHNGDFEAADVTDDGFVIWQSAIAPARIYKVIL